MLRRINSSSSNRAPMPHMSNGRDLTQNLTYMRVTLDSWSWLRNIIKRIGKLDNLPVTANKCYKSALMLTTGSMYWQFKYWMLEQHIWTSWLPLSLKVLIFVTNLRHLFTMPPEITRSLDFSDRECDACVIVVAIWIQLFKHSTSVVVILESARKFIKRDLARKWPIYIIVSDMARV